MANPDRPYTPEAAELYLALEVLRERLPQIFEPDKYNFSHKGKCWVDGVDSALAFMQDKLAEDAQ